MMSKLTSLCVNLIVSIFFVNLLTVPAVLLFHIYNLVNVFSELVTLYSLNKAGNCTGSVKLDLDKRVDKNLSNFLFLP